MAQSIEVSSPKSHTTDTWCPPNMKHSHIGEFIDYFQKIVEIDKGCYTPLIKELGYHLYVSNDITSTNEELLQLSELFSKVEKNKERKIEKKDSVGICNFTLNQLKEEKSEEEEEERNEKLKTAKEELETAKEELEKAEKELKKAENELNGFCCSDENFYKLLSCVFENKNHVKYAVTAFILRLFNHLAISILKAEYSLFDNYSDVLTKITGFEGSTSDEFKIKYVNDNKSVKNEERIIPPSQYVDQYLIKSIINCVWHLIEICKTIDHKINKDKFDAFFQVVNKNRKQRINTIYPIHGEKELIEREIVDLFELSIESILDLTLIDHYFCFTKENFERLFIANDRMNSLHDAVTPEVYDNTDIQAEEKKYDFRNPFASDGIGNSLIDFRSIKNIVEIKSKLLLKQLKESFDSKPINNKKFDDQFNFLFYGVKNEDDTKNFDEYINNSTCFNFTDRIEYNNYTKTYFKILNGESEECRKDDSDFSFLVKYNDEQLEKCGQCGSHAKKRCQKHCSTGKCNTKRDIIEFNTCSEISIDNFLKNSPCLKTIKSLRRNDGYEKLIKDKPRLTELLKEIDSVLFEQLPNFNNKTLDRLKLNPTNLIYYISFFNDILDRLIQELEDTDSMDSVAFNDKLTIIKDIFKNYQKFTEEFNIYIRAKENTAYTTGEFRFFPPFQYCFYQLKELKNRSDNKKYQLKTIEREEDDFVGQSNDGFFKNNIESYDFFFFLSIGLHPVNIFQLSEKNKQFQHEFSLIGDRISTLKSKETLERIAQTHEKGFEASKQNNIQILGILGSFIAFVSFSTGTLKAVDTVAEFVIFAFIFCLAAAAFGFIVRIDSKEFKNLILENGTSKLKPWLRNVLLLASVILLICLALFAFKSFKNGEVDKTEQHLLKVETTNSINAMSSENRDCENEKGANDQHSQADTLQLEQPANLVP